MVQGPNIFFQGPNFTFKISRPFKPLSLTTTVLFLSATERFLNFLLSFFLFFFFFDYLTIPSPSHYRAIQRSYFSLQRKDLNFRLRRLLARFAMGTNERSDVSSERRKWDKVFSGLVHMLQTQQGQLETIAKERKLLEDCVRMQHKRWVSDGRLYEGQISQVILKTIRRLFWVLENGWEFEIRVSGNFLRSTLLDGF